MRSNLRALLVFFVVLLGSAGCDHASKQLAVSALGRTGSVSVAGDMVRLELTWNFGGFLSLGAALPEDIRRLFFMGIVPLIALGLCVYLLRIRETSLATFIGLGLVAGGGLANWLDRLLNAGAVTDFISVGVGPLRTGVFNVADVAVVAGVAILLVFTRAKRASDPARPA